MNRQRINDRWTEGHAPWVELDGNAPFRYRVESQSSPLTWHLVDLTARDGHGECSCINFATVARPNFDRHKTWIPWAKGRQGASECIHLRAAWDYFHLNTAVPMMAAMKDGIPPQ
jgi:hypothetical protein